MFLKNLEIRGFKSFADRTELTFTNGITSIVGPNGSGKSNISDAVRWVLGEQSIKNLRGGKMEDVIFSGTQFRKPVSLCQVLLTLDNSDRALPLDYTSVTISRRLYRSGESEYYINNTKCRLKDVYELFMDTGIGKEGYSIIGQGKIDAILNGKPEDRRGILEEAAGIGKFKWRKEESEKKLKNTSDNLTRIEDILGTYRKRLGPLSIENEKANRFLQLSKGLKEREINLLVNSMDKLQTKINDLNKVVYGKKIDINSLNSRINVLKKNLDIYNSGIDKKENIKKGYEKKYYDEKNRIQKLNSSIDVLREKTSNIKQNIEKNISQYKILNDKLRYILKQKDIREKEYSAMTTKQKDLVDNIKNHKFILDKVIKNVSSKNSLINNLKNNQIEYLSSISNIKNNIVSIEDNIKKIDDRIVYIEKSCANCDNSIKLNIATKLRLASQINHIKTKIKELNCIIEENKKEISKIRYIIKKDTTELKIANQNCMKLKVNRNMLVNLDRHYEGYNRSVKVLMNHIRSGKTSVNSENCFLLGEVIRVDKKFEIAVEVALGSAISNIITLNEDIAKKLISYLKVNKIGRATFLPLNIVHNKRVLNLRNISGIKGYLGLASEIVNYNIRFKNAVENALGRTVISDDLNSALNIAKYSNYTIRIVTLNGELVNPGGALTGGSFKSNFGNILGRKRKISDLEKQIGSAEKHIEILNRDLAKNENSIRKNDETNLNLNDKIYSNNIDIIKLSEKLNSINSENVKLKKNIDISKNEMSSMINTKKNLDLELENKRNELKKLNLTQEDNSKSIFNLEKELKDKNNSIEEFRNKFTDIKIKKARIDEGILNKSRLIKSIYDDIKEIHSKISDLKVEEKSLKYSKENSIKQIYKNKSEIKIIESSIDRLKNKIDKLKIDQLNIKKKMKDSSNKLQLLNDDINIRKNEIHNFQLNLTKFITKKENLNSKLNLDFDINYEDAHKYKSYIEDIESFKKNIDDLKKKISNIGTVNLGAIEEYKKIKEKVDFMNSQRDDLVKAVLELQDVIKEMTRKMKEVFNCSFTKLRKNFNKTFQELFKGGSADLLLTEGDELTGNIDITVQPPGKKLQNINLLSGGEKGLSAIALLFAILKMKPTPFCILDEIEAALDDANVVRYAEFLKKFSNRTQFIVITHRKGTMEVSDVMYGVTMEEKGISKIVSMDLNKKMS